MRQLLWITILLMSVNLALSDDFFKEVVSPSITNAINTTSSAIKFFSNLLLRPNVITPKERVIDTKEIFNAINSEVIDDIKIINILMSYKIEDHELLKKNYLAAHGASLLNNLRDKLSGVSEKLMVAYLTPKDEYLATEIHNSMQGIASDESPLLDTLCVLDWSKINSLNETYKDLYNHSIIDDLKKYTTGDFQRLMTSCVTVDRSKYISDKDLVPYIEFFGFSSFETIKQYLYDYRGKYNKFFENEIKKIFHGDLQRAVTAISQYAKQPAIYYCARFYQILENENDIDYQSLVRLVIMDKLDDMRKIKNTYDEIRGRDLYEDIKSKTTKSFGHFLDNIVKK